MTIELTMQNIITAGAVVTAIVLLVQRFAKGVRWFDRQEQQTADIDHLRTHHDTDMRELRDALAAGMAVINEEQTLLTYGVLSCLKGLVEKGCDGPCKEAVAKIEKHLNEKAHRI